MNDIRALEEIPTIKQKAFLGKCSNIARNNFLRYIYKLPLNRARMNYEVLSNNRPHSDAFIHNVVSKHKKWLRNERAKSSGTNGAIYDQAMDCIKNKRGI